MPKPVSTLLIAVLALVTLVFSSRTASATENAYLAIKGQKSGQMHGEVTQAAYYDQFELRNFSMTPATAGTGSFTMSGTVSYYALARFFNSMVQNELITETTVTVDKPGVTLSAPRVKEFAVRMINAYFTEIDVDFAQGTTPVFSFKLTTVPSGKISYTDANGNNLTTAIPAVAGLPIVTSASIPTFSAKLKTSGGEIDSPIQSISWRVVTPGGGVGKPTLGTLSFTRAADASTNALKAAAARGDSLTGTTVKCMYTPKLGDPPTRVLELQLDSAKFATAAAPATTSGLSGSLGARPPTPSIVTTGPEKYDVAFTTPPVGGHDLTVLVPVNTTSAVY